MPSVSTSPWAVDQGEETSLAICRVCGHRDLVVGTYDEALERVMEHLKDAHGNHHIYHKYRQRLRGPDGQRVNVRPHPSLTRAS